MHARMARSVIDIILCQPLTQVSSNFDIVLLTALQSVFNYTIYSIPQVVIPHSIRRTGTEVS